MAGQMFEPTVWLWSSPTQPLYYKSSHKRQPMEDIYLHFQTILHRQKKKVVFAQPLPNFIIEVSFTKRIQVTERQKQNKYIMKPMSYPYPYIGIFM